METQQSAIPQRLNQWLNIEVQKMARGRGSNVQDSQGEKYWQLQEKLSFVLTCRELKEGNDYGSKGKIVDSG